MKTILLSAAMILGGAQAIAQDNTPKMPDQGGILALSCAACHGTDGRSASAMPTLEGHSLAFIRNRMLAFQSGKRPSTVMGRIAKGYTAEEIELIAAHFAALNKEQKP